ncbi:hypothetical protein TSUD_206100 [Trifolium subterraneum]|uniref:Uncharacterized protein n=1 Tax=Trifolium subterraneum TaxID=3900 RepID=A0A2Z6MP48_TRISU|nr:hypothetical protein TSUD_206100 [Trifolium subterraneum]
MAGPAPEELLVLMEYFWTVCDESYDSFDAMGLQEILLKGIYAYVYDLCIRLAEGVAPCSSPAETAVKMEMMNMLWPVGGGDDP